MMTTTKPRSGELATKLDNVKPDWRDTHVILLDNMASHKTKNSIKVLENIRAPYLFSAPASYKAMPIESVFKYLKLTDFRQTPMHDALIVKDRTQEQLTHKERHLSRVSHFLLSMSDNKIKKIFYERLAQLRGFLALERV